MDSSLRGNLQAFRTRLVRIKYLKSHHEKAVEAYVLLTNDKAGLLLAQPIPLQNIEMRISFSICFISISQKIVTINRNLRCLKSEH
jgi:hypothetical protein